MYGSLMIGINGWFCLFYQVLDHLHVFYFRFLRFFDVLDFFISFIDLFILSYLFMFWWLNFMFCSIMFCFGVFIGL
jgi:hypothetical protein